MRTWSCKKVWVKYNLIELILFTTSTYIALHDENDHKLIASITLKSRRRQWQPTPVLSPGKSCGWKSLVGCSPWGHSESNKTERLHFRFSLSCIGEGNGNPLQCSCLENPRDGGAWWAAVYGVAQSQTRLKWLSSSHTVLHSGYTSFHSHKQCKRVPFSPHLL